ncbi:hypothetical protein [Nodularia chucula]|uniref:hypothetical protein n=1 Tax=Nodularia chucula TaxID=3093667 RepID=UPI0039C6C1C8
MKLDQTEIYADGAEIMFSHNLTKLKFYSVVDVSENNGEIQTEEELKVQIAIPTLSLLRLCAGFLHQIKTDEKEVIAMIDSNKEEIIKTLEKFTLNNSL